MGLGTGEIILIAFVIMLLFGATKLPKVGEGLGRAIGSFKRALRGFNEVEASAKAEPDAAQPEPAKTTDKAP